MESGGLEVIKPPWLTLEELLFKECVFRVTFTGAVDISHLERCIVHSRCRTFHAYNYLSRAWDNKRCEFPGTSFFLSARGRALRANIRASLHRFLKNDVL